MNLWFSQPSNHTTTWGSSRWAAGVRCIWLTWQTLVDRVLEEVLEDVEIDEM